MAITIDYTTRVISIPKADMTLIQSTPIEIRALDINIFRLALKDLEDDARGIPFVDTHSHNTIVTIGGVTLARVVEIINGYTVTFENGSYAVNLVGANSNIGDVVNLNTVSVRAANSAGLIGLSDISAATATSMRLIEGLRPHHKGYGDIWYWDPINGSDTNDGTTPSTACATFAHIHDNRVSDWGHDVVLIMSKNITTTLVITETISITKNWMFLRGAGFNARFRPTTVPASKAVITINSEGVQLSSMHIDLINCADANSIGIKKTGKYFHLSNVTIKRAAKQGLISTNGHDEVLEDFMIAYCGTDGIEITNEGVGSEAEDITIRNGHIDANGTNGINLTGTAVHETILKDGLLLHGNGQYGLKVGTGGSQTHIFPEVIFRDNVLGEISDSGVDTMDSRFAVWNEPIAGHLTAGTTGKALSDASSAGNPWSTPITGNTNAGTFGELVGKKLLTISKFLGLK